MKIRFLTTLFLVFISCNNVTNNKTEQVQILADSTSTKIESVKKQNDVTELALEFDEISEVINSVFKVDNLELKDVYKPWETEYYSLLDSTKIKSFQNYSEFIIIEFNNSKSSKSEFNKINVIAEKSIKNKKELFPYYHVFRKGGVSFNRIDKWIIVHFLRCNMNPKDYYTDKQFTTKLENLGFEVNLIRMRCGWAKAEFN